MDKSQLSKITNVNPRDIGFHIKIVDVENSEFLISEEWFKQLDLDVNGLTQYLSPDGDIYLAVEDGDHAIFFKNSNKGDKKKRRFKNKQLMFALDKKFLNLSNGDYVEMELENESEGLYFCKLIRNKSSNVSPADEPKKIASKKTTKKKAPIATEQTAKPEPQEEAPKEDPMLKMAQGAEEEDDFLQLY